MTKAMDLLSQRFGRLIVIEREGNDKSGKTIWKCVCDCGQTTSVQGSSLKSGTIQSCGCLGREKLLEYGKTAAVIHDMSRSSIYAIWTNIVDRCYNEKNPNYHRYGGRGITMCDEWRNSFEAFYHDMGERPSVNYSIDRRDNDKGYCKDNCRWATSQEQAANRQRSLYFEYKGERKLLIEWCRTLNLKYSLVYYRIKVLKWEFHEAIQPIEYMPITFEGEVKSLQEWCDLFNLRYNQTYLRVLRGESFEQIIQDA